MKSSPLLTALCFGLFAATAWADPPPPAAAPGFFRAVLSPDAYEKEIGQLDQDRLDPAKILADGTPPFGTRMVSVTPGGPADAAGVRPGWTLVRCDGREIWSRLQSWGNEGASRDLVFVTPAGEEKPLHFKEKYIQIEGQDSLRLEHVLLQSVPRGPWDRDLAAVSQCWTRGWHDLAETALNHAVAKGMPTSPCTDYYTALLALDRGNLDLARSMKDAVVKAVAPKGAIPHFYYDGLLALALAFNDIFLLERCARESEGWDGMLQPAQVEGWRRQGFGDLTKSLLPYALAHAGEDVSGSVVAPKDGFESEFSMFDPRNAKKNYWCSAPVGKYNGLCFTGPEPMHDLIWEIKGMYGDAPEAGRHNFYINLFDAKVRRESEDKSWDKPLNSFLPSIFAINDGSPIRTLTFFCGTAAGNMENRRNLPHLTQEETAKLSADFRNHVEIKAPNEAHVFDFKFICIGKQVEVLMNGAPVMHVPIGPEVQDIGCEFRFSGCEAYIFSSSLRPIKSDAPPADGH
jgi:hypothetical protein